MATPQGNAIAYQAAKPVEAVKVGDLYSNLIGTMVNNNKAKEAAELKRKTDEGKMFSDLMKDWKVDYKSTLSPFQDASNESVKAAVDKIDFAKRIASDPNYTYDEKTKASMSAKNAMDGSLQLQTFLTNPEMKKTYMDNLQLIGEGKAFRGDDRLGLYNSAAVGAWKSRFNEDGTIEVAYAKQNDTKDSPLEWSPLSDIMTKYSTPIELNQADDYNKYLMDSAQKITTETTNDNGVIKTYTKKFDTKDAKILLASSFGYDPNKPLEEQFASNAVPVKLNHWYYQNTGKKIENNEDFGKAIDASVEQMRAAADEKVTTEVKKTAAEQENLRLRNIKLRKDIARPDSQASAKEDKTLGNGALSVGNVVLNIKNSNGALNHYETKGLSYFVNGNTNQGKTSKIGITTYWNPNGGSEGKGGFSFGMNIPSKDGKKVVIEGVDSERAKQILASNKVKDPQNVLAMMATLAEQNGISGTAPKGIGRNFSNYKVNFDTDYKKQAASPKNGPTGVKAL